MNPKYRSLYLTLGFAALAFLIYTLISSYPDLNPAKILIITIPDIVFFFLAYRTYPVENNIES